MFFIHTILLAAFAAALPISEDEQAHNGFSMEVSGSAVDERDFKADLMAARKKWGSKPSVKGFRLGETSGRVEVNPLGYDEIYIADVNIGNPPQMVKLAIDTGSNDLWVQSSDTIYKTNVEGPFPPRYMPNTSFTAELVKGAQWSVDYVDGTGANGVVYYDTLRLGPFTINQAPVQSAKIVAQHFEREHGMSGVLGLGKRLDSNITPASPTLLSILRKQLKKPVFTVDVRSNDTGRFEFGVIDESRGKDKLTWIDSIAESKHWDLSLNLTGWSGDPTWYAHEFNATIDTGTTLMFLPDIIASRYWLAVDGMKVDPAVEAYTFLCDSALPDLSFKLPDGHVINIPGRYLNYGPIDEGTYCWGGMQNTEGMGPGGILGDTMLKSVFLAFDLENEKIGIANKDLRVNPA